MDHVGFVTGRRNLPLKGRKVQSMSRLITRILEPEDVLTCHAGIVDAYSEVFAEPPWDEDAANFDAFAESLLEYGGWPGFRGAVLVDNSGAIQGFTLGGDWISDNWWCSGVTEDLGPRAGEWTSSCFHLIELAVRREHRCNGYGADLYDALVRGLPHRTAILSTNKLGPVAAARLYARRGWRLLLEDWRHCDQCPPVQVLGLREPALSARAPWTNVERSE
jgi:GNAT superfamily N-acetyltransferase